MRWSRTPEGARRRGAFTLVEVMVALVIMALMMSALTVPLAAHLNMRRQQETRRALEEAKEALLGFAAAHARLPCPASEGSNGLESFAVGGDATNGQCSNFFDGLLPGASLGLSPLDSEGFVRDAWPGPRNRIRYAVFGDAAVNGVSNPLTRAGGMQMATLAGLGAASHYLVICSSGALATPASCGPASNQLTRRAALVLLSLGPNATASPPAGSDEARNIAGHSVFVHREASMVAGNEFDDVLLWVPVHLVVNRLLTAGRLP